MLRSLDNKNAPGELSLKNIPAYAALMLHCYEASLTYLVPGPDLQTVMSRIDTGRLLLCLKRKSVPKRPGVKTVSHVPLFSRSTLGPRRRLFLKISNTLVPSSSRGRPCITLARLSKGVTLPIWNSALGVACDFMLQSCCFGRPAHALVMHQAGAS